MAELCGLLGKAEAEVADCCAVSRRDSRANVHATDPERADGLAEEQFTRREAISNWGRAV